MKKILYIIAMIFLLASCGKQEQIVETKSDYLIETKKFSEFGNSYSLEKSGKINSSQDINLVSKANGEIREIKVKEGSSVKKGDLLISMSDTTSNYALNLEKTRIQLEASKINYDSQKINLEKRISDNLINLEKTKKTYDISKARIDEDMKKAKIDFENSKFDNSGTTSALELQRITENIEKAKLDYNNLLNSNKEQINTFLINSKKEYNNLVLAYTDIIEYSDNVLGVRKENKDKNDSFEDYLGARNRGQKSETLDSFNELLTYNEKLITYDKIDLNESNIIEFMENFYNGYKLISDFLNSLENTLINSIDSVDFTKSNFIKEINLYQSQVSNYKSSFNATKSSITTFLNTYKSNEKSVKKQIDIMYKNEEISEKNIGDGKDIGEITYNKIVLDLKEKLNNLETSLKNAQLDYENSLKTRDVTLRSLNNAIKNSNNSLKQAQKEYSKLFIKSPIDGIIGKINVEIAQEISNGSPLLSLSNESKGEIEIDLTKDELNLVSEGQNVLVKLNDKSLNGTIYSISKIADSNLNYITKISLEKKVDIVGNIVNIKIPINLNNSLLPIKIVETMGENKGQIRTYKNGKLEQKIVELGNIWGNSIEILTLLDNNTNIVVSEIKNYDENKFNLKVKNN